MSKIKSTVLAIAAAATIAAGSLVAFTAPVYADDPPAASNPTDRALDGFNTVRDKTGATNDLEGSIGNILNVVYTVIGIVAVVMIILGGVSYATSQGDAGKVKKGKDTIMYGIIGLIIVLLAFAITNFVLTNINLGA